MYEAIISTLTTMGWLGIILGILVLVNTICGTMVNLNNGEAFSFKKMFKGIFKSAVFYGSAALTSIAFTMLPFINEMITTGFGVALISTELLNTLSSIAVLGVVVATVVHLGKKALEGILNLANMAIGEKEVITWEVDDVVEEDKEEE